MKMRCWAIGVAVVLALAAIMVWWRHGIIFSGSCYMFPGNGSPHEADRFSHRLEKIFDAECEAVMERLKACATSDVRRTELDAEFKAACAFACCLSEGSAGEAGNVHWGNVDDRMTRMRTMEVFLRNWREGCGHQEGFETVRSATGTLHGVAFAATGGVAILTVPSSWVDRRWAERNGDDPDTLDPDVDEVFPQKWQLLLRLSPAHVKVHGGNTSTRYELIAPGVHDSGYMVERGEMVI